MLYWRTAALPLFHRATAVTFFLSKPVRMWPCCLRRLRCPELDQEFDKATAAALQIYDAGVRLAVFLEVTDKRWAIEERALEGRRYAAQFHGNEELAIEEQLRAGNQKSARGPRLH
ncbi:hypothetical protein AAFF_G00030190 [Aldrovandia affinis]|uniref:Uncharacterized protein n=1 Tax=Aldrovandia affinis TaxID=143900 RepID=A0AAD7S495_9TELE|nr:hypothetical protein AAFF_G00030190 [Aldrovandia affinis]